MTPAEELRAAATRVREVAKEATPGPWRIDAECSDMVISPEPAWTGGPTVIAGDLHDGTPIGDWDNVAWIALTSPALAEPLADLLDDVGDLIDSHPDLARPHVDGEPCGDLACRIVHHALAVARTILGGPDA